MWDRGSSATPTAATTSPRPVVIGFLAPASVSSSERGPDFDGLVDHRQILGGIRPQSRQALQQRTCAHQEMNNRAMRHAGLAVSASCAGGRELSTGRSCYADIAAAR